jgi:hypothetical protein
MILKTNAEYVRAIKRLAAKKPKFFYMATFNISVDDTFTEILNTLPENCETRILIGVHSKAVNKGLPDFLKRYFKDKKVSYKLAGECHTKLLVTSDGGIIGGRNYTGSEWDDVCMKFKSAYTIRKMKQYFQELYKSKKSIG